MLIKQLPATIRGSIVWFLIEFFQLIIEGIIHFPDGSEDLVAQRTIDMIINNFDSTFHHRFITGLKGSGGREGRTIILAELISHISEHRFITVRARNSSF